MSLNSQSKVQYKPLLCNNKIIEVIEQNKGHAMSDILIKNSTMTGYWCITDSNQIRLSYNQMHHKQWDSNLAIGAEATSLLELI